MSLKLAIINLLSLSLITLSGAVNRRQVGPDSKAGLGWPNGPYDDIRQYTTTGKVSWYYTWSPDSIDTTLEYVPMLWGERQISQWTNTINQTIRNRNVTHALAFNEPQQIAQSNLSSQQGADLWRTYVQPLKVQGIRLGSPATSSAPSGKTWLQGFIAACGDCTVDFTALHWYGINSTEFVVYLQDFHNTFQRPIWVTEWACQNFVQADGQCSQQDVINFMNATQSFMDQTEWVERYSWFGAMKEMQGVNEYNRIMGTDGRINDLGRQYIGAAPPTTTNNYTPGVVSGGKGEQPGDDNNSGSSSPATFILSSVFSTLVTGLFIVLT